MTSSAPRTITLCADDYGLSEGVNSGIRELISQGRLNATSVMVIAPAFTREEVSALSNAAQEGASKRAAASGTSRPCQIGLHVTLTAPFRPLTMHFEPLDEDAFHPLPATLLRALLHRLDPDLIQDEIESQIAAFQNAFSHPPAFVDGHQHVQIFPQVREAFLAAVKQHAPDAWVRQSGRRIKSGGFNPKAMLLDGLSATFRELAAKQNVATNQAFAGAYDFSRGGDYGALFAGFVDALPQTGGLIMCHPGYVDEGLRALDPLTDQRERELAFFASDAFARLLADKNVTLS